MSSDTLEKKKRLSFLNRRYRKAITLRLHSLITGRSKQLQHLPCNKGTSNWKEVHVLAAHRKRNSCPMYGLYDAPSAPSAVPPPPLPSSATTSLFRIYFVCAYTLSTLPFAVNVAVLTERHQHAYLPKVGSPTNTPSMWRSLLYETR